MSDTGRLDQFIEWLSPRWAAQRMAYREAMNGYRGAIRTRNSGVVWPHSTQITGTRLPTSMSLESMRDRSRNLDRNNALASATLDRAVENVVGTEIRVEPRTGDERFDARARELWNQWKRRCDVRGVFSFQQMQQQVYRALLRDGDVGVVLVDRGGPMLQCIEGDQIKSPPGQHAGGMSVDGVELNPVNGPRAYFVRTIDERNRATYTRVASRNMAFLARLGGLSEVRGVPVFSQCFELFDYIQGYLEGTVISARTAAYFSLVIKRNNSEKLLSGLGRTTNSAGRPQATINLEPGSIQYLEPGEDVVQIKPEQPGQSFPDAIVAFSRFVGLKLGLTIEQVLLDFSRANYSSSRAARLQANQTAEMEQANFAENFVSRVYRWAVSKWVNDGLFGDSIPPNHLAHEWIPQGKPWVDPTKEIDAAIRATEFGIDARSNIAMERGYDFGELCRRNEQDRKLMESHGLTGGADGEEETEGPDSPAGGG